MPTTGNLYMLTLADALWLVSPWKPLLLVVTLAAWAWVISTIYDKHAARFFLPRNTWNLVHLCIGLAAVLAAVFMPVEGALGILASWGAMVVLLMTSLASYAISVKNDDRVPDEHKISFRMKPLTEAQKDAKRKSKSAGTVKLAIKAPDKTTIEAPPAQTPEYELRNAAEDLYIQGLAKRASQIDIAPVGKDGSYAPSFLIDGVRQSGDAIPAANALRLMDFWKAASKLDLADRRRKLSGDISITQGTDTHKVRVTSIGVPGGMRLTMLYDFDTSVRRKPEELGFLPEQMNELKILIGQTQKSPEGNLYPEEVRKGVVLMAGVPDGGRTTTLMTILQMHDAYTSGVVTVEVEQQVNLEGIRHTVYDPAAEGADYSTTVRSQLRRDPDVLGVAEVPDAKTMQEAARTDLERIRIYLCLRAESTMAAVEAYVKGLGDNDAAAKSLRGVITHKLMRRLCTNCRVAYPPSADMLKKLGVPEGKVQQLYKKGGQVLIKNKPEVCPVCAGIGYYGQEGVFEIYRFGPEEAELLAQGNLAGVKASLRRKNLPTLQQAALRKAIAGVTSLEEVTRVTSGGA